MAGEWNKMKDKMGAPSGGPSPGDWEAMRAKIDAHPSLAPKAGQNPWLGWLIAGSLGLLIGLGTWYFWSPVNVEQLDKPNQSISTVDSEEAKPEASVDPITSSDTETINEGAIKVQEVEEKSNVAVTENASQAGLTDNTETALDESTSINVDDNVNASRQPKEELAAADKKASSVINTQESKMLSMQDHTMADAESKIESEKENESIGLDVEANEGMSSDQNKSSNLNSEGADTAGEPDLDPALATQSQDQDAEPALDSILQNSEAPKPGPANSKPFMDPKTGFKLGGASTFVGAMHELRAQSPLVYGGGFDLQWYNKRKYFSAGISYYRIEQVFEQKTHQTYSRIDSSWKLNVEDKEVLEVSRVWVIDSFQAGHYVYDTTRTLVRDSTYVLQVDTNHLGSSIVNQVERPYYFAELPLLYGYGLRSGNWNFRLAGGLALQQAIAYSNDESGSKSLFGVTALLQPQIDWRLNDRWSVLSRVQMRYPIKQEFVLYEQAKLRYSFQMGVSYRW